MVGIDFLIANYAVNLERSSEAACRTALDFYPERVLDSTCEHRSSIMGGISIHLYIHQKGNHLKSEDQATENRAHLTPKPWDNIKVFGEVSFSHTITPPANGKSVGSFSGVTVNGRVDHGIGCEHASTPSRRGSINVINDASGPSYSSLKLKPNSASTTLYPS